MHRLLDCVVYPSAVPVAACIFTSLRTLPFGRSRFLPMFCFGISSQSHGLPCVRVDRDKFCVTIESGLCDVREVVWWGLMKSRLRPPAPTMCWPRFIFVTLYGGRFLFAPHSASRLSPSNHSLPHTRASTHRKMLLSIVKSFLLTFALLMMVEAATQRVGDECNWKKNCQAYADGVGPAWANGAITCAIPQSQTPETCGSGNDNRSDFWG